MPEARWFWTPTAIEDLMAIFPRDLRNYDDALDLAIVMENSCRLTHTKRNGAQVYRSGQPWRFYCLVVPGDQSKGNKLAVAAAGPPSSAHNKPPSFDRYVPKAGESRSWWLLSEGDIEAPKHTPVPPSERRALVDPAIQELDELKRRLGMSAAEIGMALTRMGFKIGKNWRNVANGNREVDASELDKIKALCKRLKAIL